MTAVIELALEDDGDCLWSVLNGFYPMTWRPDIGAGAWFSTEYNQMLMRMLPLVGDAGPCGYDACLLTTSDGWLEPSCSDTSTLVITLRPACSGVPATGVFADITLTLPGDWKNQS
jgi:hypothetical protein